MAKRILAILLLFSSFFFLFSCSRKEWEEYPTSFITAAGIEKNIGDFDHYILYVDITVTEGAFEEARKNNMDYYIKVSLDIVYFEYYESKYSSIEDVDFIVHITKPGNNRYTADIICSEYLNDKNFKGLLMEVHVNKATYICSNPNISASDPAYIRMIFGIFFSVVIAALSFVLVASFLGLIVNSILTKKFKKMIIVPKRR